MANVRTLEVVTADSVAPRRMSMVLLAAFAGIALLLASVGIYGVISYLVVQRTHEIGVRMALGAQRTRCVASRRRSRREAGWHWDRHRIGAGVLVARARCRLCFTASATFDAATFVVVTFALAAIALLASYIPALRATRADPMIALSHNA